jgi:hypothetical protein
MRRGYSAIFRSVHLGPDDTVDEIPGATLGLHVDLGHVFAQHTDTE